MEKISLGICVGSLYTKGPYDVPDLCRGSLVNMWWCVMDIDVSPEAFPIWPHYKSSLRAALTCMFRARVSSLPCIQE